MKGKRRGLAPPSGHPAAAVRSAGGLVFPPGRSGRPEVAVVHRRQRDDWTLPKGRLEAGEAPVRAALREVEEETGMRCQVVRHAGCTVNVDRRGRDRVVAYWVMRPLTGRFRPNDEVDELRWLPFAQAAELLTNPIDRALLAAQALS